MYFNVLLPIKKVPEVVQNIVHFTLNTITLKLIYCIKSCDISSRVHKKSWLVDMVLHNKLNMESKTVFVEWSSLYSYCPEYEYKIWCSLSIV